MTDLQKIQDAIVGAYNHDELKQLLFFDLDVDCEAHFNVNAGLRSLVFEVLRWCERRGRLLELVWAAYERRRAKPELAAIVAGLRATPSPYADRRLSREDWRRLVAEGGDGLESIARAGVKFSDTLPWITQLARAFACVCRVEPQPVTESRGGYGTAFLVADDVVLTNCHVVRGFKDHAKVRFRFDHAVTEDGGDVLSGRETSLAADWDIARSPVEKLDFALVRLAEKVGLDTVRGSPRGALRLTKPVVEVGHPVVIIQHPAARPMQLAMGAVIEPEAANGRLEYDANTEPGSSGSPCFTSALELMAVHRRGAGTSNEGIRTDAILKSLMDPERRQRVVDAGMGEALCD